MTPLNRTKGCSLRVFFVRRFRVSFGSRLTFFAEGGDALLRFRRLVEQLDGLHAQGADAADQLESALQARLAMAIAVGLSARISLHQRSTSASNSACGTTRLTMPIASASCAL